MPDIYNQNNVQPEVSPEQIQELRGLMDGINQKVGEYNSVNFASRNKIDLDKKEMLKEVFEAMQAAGVDLTDQSSVAQFMEKLKESNPQLYQWFEEAMNGLLGEEQNNENINNEYEQPNQQFTPPEDLS